MSWVAIIPLKQGSEQKSRLSGILSAGARASFMEGLYRHVLAQLDTVPEVSRVVLLSPRRPPRCEVEWCADLGRGLNTELANLRSRLPKDNILVIHADLPILRASDVSQLISAAERAGVAIAPDRHGAGTNAIALLCGQTFRFTFGAGSYGRLKRSTPHAAVVVRHGLSYDIDTPEDLGLWSLMFEVGELHRSKCFPDVGSRQ